MQQRGLQNTLSDPNQPTPYSNRNSHVGQTNGAQFAYGRGGSAPKELIPNSAEMASYYNNQTAENVQLLSNRMQGVNINRNALQS